MMSEAKTKVNPDDCDFCLRPSNEYGIGLSAPTSVLICNSCIAEYVKFLGVIASHKAYKTHRVIKDN